ncbi:MAG: alpha/beta fold hydrolase [Myxococcales bacterium]|nr:alpha/beta fold hydrolase [Myxococcales bacterium]
MTIRVLMALALLGCKGKPAAVKEQRVADARVAAGERWGGAIEIAGQVPLEFELMWMPGPAATMAIPQQGLAATALVDVTATGNAMTFTLQPPGAAPAAYARFAVERAADGTTARGTLKQNGAELPVRMRRLADGEVVGAAPVRPQEPKPPLPYDAREASYASKDGTRLAGTLTVPRGGGPHPAVVLITGTGAQDRDESLAGHKPFLVLADHLTRHGVAVLRVDDRGVGGSGGDTAATDLDGKVEDALAGVAWLRQQPDIDGARVGLVGHSEGGVIAPMAASRPDARIAFIVLLAGPGVTGAQVSLRQLEQIMRVGGSDEATIKAAVDGQRVLLAAQARTADPVELRKAIEARIDQLAQLASPVERAQFTGDARTAMITNGLAGLASPASRSFSLTDPAPYLAKVRCPVLALGGSLDLQVAADENLAAIQAALARGGNPDVTVATLPGLNHLFQPARRGLIDEYAQIETTFDPAALERVSTWLTARAAR